jgi:hypothetical protein
MVAVPSFATHGKSGASPLAASGSGHGVAAAMAAAVIGHLKSGEAVLGSPNPLEWTVEQVAQWLLQQGWTGCNKPGV